MYINELFIFKERSVVKENRIKKIFEILTDEFKPYTATEISHIVNFSSKTVREDIKELNSILENNGAKIMSKPGVGYRFIISNKDKFSKFIKEDWPKYALDEDLNNQEYRVNQIILTLLSEKTYIKSDIFLDLLFISRSQLNQDLKLVREILSENHIEIESKPHYGMKIYAKEIDIRTFLVKYVEENSKYNKNILQEVSKIDAEIINQISTLILSQFKEYGFDTNLVKYNNFINYLVISISRIRDYFLISDKNKNEPIYEKYSSIYKLSLSIASNIEKICDVNLDDKEIEYIYINLLSKIDSYIPSEYNENIEKVIEKSLTAIKNTLSIDLSNDNDLKSSLMIHLNPMIKRIKYGIKLKNPLLEDIKKDHLAMECANLCSSYISDAYNIKIDLDELCYVALHFSASLAKSREHLNKKNILLVCASGRATARVLKYRFMHEFSKYINLLDTSDYLMTLNMDLKPYDLIVTTIPISLTADIPIIQVSAYLYKKDVDRVLDALKIKEDNENVKKLFKEELFFKSNNNRPLDREDILNEMIDKINVDKNSYYNEIIKRENLANTGLENKVAIPHPLNPVTNDNFIGIYVSTNSINWIDRNVNIVILLNLNDNIERSTVENFFKYLSNFLNDDKKILNATKTESLKEFQEIFFKQ